MVCKGCGTEIADGQEYCDACKLSMEEDAVITLTKDDIKKAKKGCQVRLTADGPFINIEGYARSLKSDVTNIMALLGAVLLYLAPFFSWMKRDIEGEQLSGSLFDIGGKNAALSVHQGVLCVCAVIMIVAGLCMLILSARENIRPLRPFADMYLMRMIPALLALAAYIVVICNKPYRQALAVNGTDNGVGSLFCIVGLIVYTMSVIFSKINKKD
ncbi:MAG: hypothetical protein ACI39Q_08225 [Wujia sp.]